MGFVGNRSRTTEVRYMPMATNDGFLTDDAVDTSILIDGSGDSDHEHVTNENNNEAGSRLTTHCHDNTASQDTIDRRAERVLWAVAVMSLTFICLEFVGGWFARSLAIMSDAGHMVSDFISFLISIFAIRTARTAPTRRLSFGYARAEVLGACMSMVILWVITVVLVILAVQRVIENKFEVEGDTMLITSAAGVIFNILMAVVLHCCGQGHQHSHHGMPHDHSSSSTTGHTHSHEEQTNVNVRAAFIHVIGDLIQSVGVLISAFVIKYTNFQLADPICTFLFSIIVLFTSMPVLRDIGLLLMEAAPRHIDVGSIHKDLLGVQGVKGVHDLHVWALNMNKVALSAHLAVDSADRAVYATSDARSILQSKYALHSVTLQTELDEKNMANCGGCTIQGV